MSSDFTILWSTPHDQAAYLITDAGEEAQCRSTRSPAPNVRRRAFAANLAFFRSAAVLAAFGLDGIHGTRRRLRAPPPSPWENRSLNPPGPFFAPLASQLHRSAAPRFDGLAVLVHLAEDHLPAGSLQHAGDGNLDGPANHLSRMT